MYYKTHALMNTSNLVSALKSVMPILDKNFELATTEFYKGELANGALHYIHERHLLASSVIADVSKFDALKVWNACAMLTIDLRAGVEDMPDSASAKKTLESWWQTFREAGFTEVNQFFDIPATPVIAPPM